MTQDKPTFPPEVNPVCYEVEENTLRSWLHQIEEVIEAPVEYSEGKQVDKHNLWIMTARSKLYSLVDQIKTGRTLL